VRANERSAAGLGVNVVRVKVVSFAIASFIAGLGGSLLAYRNGTVTFDAYTALGGLTLLSTAYLAGVTSVWGGVLAGILASSGIVFVALDKWVNLGKWFAIISGVGLIITLIFNPEGLARGGQALAERIPARWLRRRRSADASADAVEVPAPEALEVVAGEALLGVQELSVRYGNVVAVDSLTIEVPAGRIVGLIGPNGAGKTSAIDGITGFARSTGTVTLSGTDLTGTAPHVRVHRGMARTFQSIELYDDLSVEENVSVAAFAASGGERSAAVARALDRLGIAELAGRPAGDLSQGERQLVSIARACAAEPRLLLLDEPAAGLDSSESEWLGDRIRAIAAGGTGVLLVDHDVALVLSVCDHIYVLDFGRLIAEGDPAAIRADRAVAEAYLGSVEEAEMRHGAGEEAVTP